MLGNRGMISTPPKLRILWLNWRDIRNPEAGGAEVFTHEVAKRLVKMSWNVTLFTSMFPGARPEEDFDGVEIVRRGGRFTVYSRAKDYCRKFVDDFDVVVDEINTRPFLTPKYVKSRPILALIHQLAREYWFYETPWPLSWLGYYYLEKSWLSRYSRVCTITVSESTRKDLVDWGFTDLRVVPEGLSVPVAEVEVQKDETPLLLFVGRLKRVKKPDDAINAFRIVRTKIPDARLMVVGDGYMRPKLERIAPAGVTFAGRIEDSIKIELMTRAHILLFPAVREGWGLTITEANARQTPAVAYDVPGVRDSVVHGQTGILVPAGDINAMADESMRLLTEQSHRNCLAVRAKEHAKTHNWDCTAGLFSEYLRQTIPL